jgi:hypothetical protein
MRSSINRTRNILILWILIGLISCSSTAEEIIPNELLKGAVQCENLNGEVQEGKSINGGTLLLVNGSVPFDIKQDQVKPTLLSVIQNGKKKMPECQWIIVFLSPAGGEGTLLQVGRAELIYNDITIEYGIPSREQLSQSVKNIEKYTDPTLKNHPDPLEAMMYDPDYTPVRLPTPEEYQLGVKIWKTDHRLNEEIVEQDNESAKINKKWNAEKYRELMKTQSERRAKRLSEQLKMSVQDLKKAKSIVSKYYILGWGKEVINLSKN